MNTSATLNGPGWGAVLFHPVSVPHVLMDSVQRIRDACAGLSEREEKLLSTEVAWSPDQTVLTRGRDAMAVEQWLRGIAQGVCGPFFLRYDEDRSSINLASNSRAPDHRLNHLKSYK